MNHTIRDRSLKKKIPLLSELFPSALYHDIDNESLKEATYFELRPIIDSDEYTCTSYLYGSDANRLQIRMGRNGGPSVLITGYHFDYVTEACEAFFRLSMFNVPLWYDGNDVFAQVRDRVDMVTQIAKERFEPDDEELTELCKNVGLNDTEQEHVRSALGL